MPHPIATTRRITVCLITAAIVAAFSAPALADYQLSYTFKHNAPAPGLDRFEFYALNDGLHNSGSFILDEEVEIITRRPMVIDLLPDGTPDILGAGVADPYNSDRSFVNIVGDPSKPAEASTTSSFGFSVPDTAIAGWTNGTTDMDVVAAHIVNTNGPPNYGPDASSAANGGRGALVAVLVVPASATQQIEVIPWGFGAGSQYTIFGYFLGATDPDTLHPFSPTKVYNMDALVIADPEPTQLPLFVGAVLLFVRRRR